MRTSSGDFFFGYVRSAYIYTTRKTGFTQKFTIKNRKMKVKSVIYFKEKIMKGRKNKNKNTEERMVYRMIGSFHFKLYVV